MRDTNHHLTSQGRKTKIVCTATRICVDVQSERTQSYLPCRAYIYKQCI